VAFRPELLKPIVLKKRSRQVCLRIKIRHQQPTPLITEHPCQVVNEGRLSDASLVVEEGDNGYAHGRLRTTDSTAVGCTSNSSCGFPLLANSRRAVAMPTPNR
jgi:hypothetical protein